MEQERLALLENQLEMFLKSYAEEMSRIKRFSLGSFYRVITLIISGAPLAVPLWLSATPAERKQAAVNTLNKYIDIPIIGEGIEAMALGFIYDIIAVLLG